MLCSKKKKQSRHASGRGGPRLTTQLAVKQLLLMAIQTKNLHRKGAQPLQIRLRREPDASKGKSIVRRPAAVCYSNT
jgi:hypothetical protein